jgi:hypothetical protein
MRTAARVPSSVDCTTIALSALSPSNTAALSVITGSSCTGMSSVTSAVSLTGWPPRAPVRSAVSAANPQGRESQPASHAARHHCAWMDPNFDGMSGNVLSTIGWAHAGTSIALWTVLPLLLGAWRITRREITA